MSLTTTQTIEASPRPSSPAMPEAQQPSVLYTAVATPVIFVSFLLSLAYVEFRDSLVQSHGHDPHLNSSSHHDDCPAWMPVWLHRLVYHRHMRTVPARACSPENENDRRRSRLRTETVEAFQVRPTVLGVLVGVAAFGIWGIGSAVWWLLL